jgi:hypothetical protein
MQVVNLYNNIYALITNNKNILYYLGMGDNPNNLEKAKKVQKRAKPQNLVDNIPLLAFYAPPGGLDRGNDSVYVAPFVFDIYTNDDVNTAHLIAEELTKVIDRKLLPFNGVDSFESRFITAHESSVDVENVYCFTIVFEFSILL